MDWIYVSAAISAYKLIGRWEKKLFPDHVDFMQQLHDRQLKITTNTHPADGVRGFEDAYPEMCKVLGKDPKENHVSFSTNTAHVSPSTLTVPPEPSCPPTCPPYTIPSKTKA